MTKRSKQKIVISIMLVLPVILALNCFLYPSEIRYSSYLVPILTGNDPVYSIDEDMSSVTYDLGGNSISVRYMNESDLNALFPDESAQGLYSMNPYTYGNWIDPDLGYVPNRFTVFEVTIINRTFAKMQLDPREALLLTNLGEELHSYMTSIPAAKYGKSFEEYYKSIRGQSGNDYYRYEMRWGMVRGKNYGLEEMIFRGDSYSGLITFDPLRPEVTRTRLVLNDVVYRFDAFNRPSDVVNVTFNFERKIDRVEVTREMRQRELEREKVKITLPGPRQLINNRINDIARNDLAIDRALGANVDAMDICFIERYRRNEVEPGNLVLSFTIEPDGTVSSQNVVEVTGINSEDFMNCILNVVRRIKFEPIQDMPTEGTNIVKGPAKPVNVTYPIDFTIYIAE